ncbi:MAG: efflux RND transporter permease subunit [Chitinispirillaceae bacterium]|nr:efflux RND transporter permease subunit [Chitinispirillaceae bacterium]
MILTDLSVKRPVLMTMVIGALVIFGLVGYSRLPLDLVPNIEFPFVTVQTIYFGAGPEEIETAVIKPIEEQMATVSGIKSITSYCSEGVGFILLEFNLGIDADLAAIDVKDKIDALLFSLPDDLQKPIIGKFDVNAMPILNLALTGAQSPEELRRIADKRIKERLLRIPGVATITVTGGREREIHVNLNKDKLDGLGISLETVAGILAANTVDIPGGHISGDRKEYTIRVQGQFRSIDEIADLQMPVSSKGEGRGSENKTVFIPLSAIAKVEDAYKEVREQARFNNRNSVGLAIIKGPQANTVKVAEQVFEAMEALNRELPEGAVIQVAQDRSEMIKDAVNTMRDNILMGMLLTALMLFVFLSDWRVTLIAALTIPASIVVAFMGMQWAGFSINFMTLMALAISVGTLVTNAIIVLENIVRHRDEGMPIREASIRGSNEVLIAVAASALTNVAVFIPMANMEGITGQFFKALGLTIVFATVASLFLSFTLAPMMASLFLKSRRDKGEGNQKRSLFASFQNGVSLFLRWLENRYTAGLRRAVGHGWIVISITAVLFIGTFVFIGPRLGVEFFPQADQGVMYINVELPSGSSMHAMDNALQTIEKVCMEIPEMSSVYSSLGGSGSETGVNYGSLIVRLKDKKERTRLTSDVINILRPRLAMIPDAKVVVSEGSMFGPQGGGDIEVEVTGEDMREILRLSDSVTAMMRTIPGLVDLQRSWKSAKPEIKFMPDRQRIDEYGTNVAQMGMSLRNALSGNDGTIFRTGDDEYTVRVQYDESHRRTIDDVENVSISTRKGIVPIKTLNTVVNEGGAANIQRKNRQRLVTVSANVAEGAAGTKAAALKKLTDRLQLRTGYDIHYGGQQEMMAESFTTLFFTLILAVILTYMVLAAIIESFGQPLLIMITIPLGLMGIVWALFISGVTMSMISIMSFIMLVGVVVNNAILIIDYAHRMQREGRNVRDAVVYSCGVKFKPILMMNLAIILAQLPQALDLNSIQGPFAVTAIGGIVVSTLMTLFVIPSLYVLFARKKAQ